MTDGALSAQDHVDIQNLYARYNLTSDAADAEGYAACFTDDGVLQSEPRGATSRWTAARGRRRGARGARVSEDVVRKSAAELAADVAGKRLSATEVTRAFLERIARLNPAVNAVCTVNPRALEDAAECDRRLRAGERPRPLEGVPFVVKDVIQTAGLRTTFGSTIHEHLVPD